MNRVPIDLGSSDLRTDTQEILPAHWDNQGMTPSISVLMPCYNNEGYVREAIESVLCQTLAPMEILVIDDGSTDGSGDVITQFGKPVRLFRQTNQGRATAMNRGLVEARGDLIAIIDADDCWRPQLLEKNVAALSASSAVMAYCQGIVIDADGRDHGRRDGKAPAKNIYENLLRGNHIFGGGPVLRTEVVRQVGGYDGQFWPCDDYHLWLRVATKGRIVFQPEPLACYRMHGEQVTQNRELMFRKMLDVKLDFLRNYPEAVHGMSRSFVADATEGAYFQSCIDEFRKGNLATAERLNHDYIRRYPLRLRGLVQWARMKLPWRIQKRLMNVHWDLTNDKTSHPAALPTE